MMDLSEALDALEAAQAEKKAAAARLDEATKEYDRLSIEVVPAVMKEHGLDSVTRGDTLIYLRRDTRANVLAANRGALAAELREMGEGSIITEYVFPQTLTSWAKDRLEDGLPIPAVVELATVTRAVPRKK